MGSGGAKKTNALAEEQQRAAQRIGSLGEDWAQESHGAGRGDIDWARGELRGLYSGLGAEGGGGGGGGGGGVAEPGFDKYLWQSETMPFYRELMGTGGLTEQERGAIESSATTPINAIYGGLLRNLQSQSRGAGLGGYGAGSSLAAQDAAYQASEASKSAFGDIARMVQAAKERGASGLTGLETEKRGLEVSERDKAYQAAKEAAARRRAAAGAGRANAEADLATKRSLINQILGLEGDKDLAYMDRGLAAVGRGTEAVNARRDETPLWQKTLASLPGAAMSAAAGAFTGGLAPAAGKIAQSALKKKPASGGSIPA